MNKVEQEIEKLKIELGEFQKKHLIVSKEKNQLKYKIQCKLKEIEKLKKLDIIPKNDLFSRDMELCISFIRKHKEVTSKQLVDYLNEVLTGLELRWQANKPLDSNHFMSRIGVYLKEQYTIGFDINGKGEGGRRTTIWYIK